METSKTDTVRHQTKRHRIRLATAIVAIAAGGLAASSPASAESPDPACSEAFWQGDNAGAEVSFFAVTFDRYTNPGAGFHEDGAPLVAGTCNPTWTD
jgi:hypothetical protein